MQTYEVVIRATVTKTYEVRAVDEKSAEELAHDMFTVSCEGPEKYEQDTVSVIPDPYNEEADNGTQ